MKFFHFGKAKKSLFGAFHPPQGKAARTTAVLLCNPFGEEAVRAHRMYRVLANRLARAGQPVLRFDHLGTGDSSGSAEDASVDEWIEGIGTAAEELRKQSGVSRVAVVGLRLGGTLATLAAAKGALAAQHLLLWDPIVEGASYLRELAASHVEYMNEEMGTSYPPPRTTPEGFPEEALGHPLSPSLVRAIADVDLAGLESLGADRVTVVTTRSTPELQRFRERHATRIAWIATSSSVPWNSDAAVNSAVVPMDVLEILMTRIEETAA